MGLINKVKKILFEEELDYTDQIKITPEMRNEEIPLKEEAPKVVYEEPKKVVEEPKKQEVKPVVSERETYKPHPSPFMDFDEDEFKIQTQIPKAEVKPVQKTTNVFEYEKRKRVEKRSDYGSYTRTEITETSEKKKFKPSPIISPVYGVLDKNYSKDDLFKKVDDKIDLQEVRNKAFGEPEMPKSIVYEATETVTITKPEERNNKVKTIDELLENTSDIIVDIDKDLETNVEDIMPELDEPEEFKMPSKVNEEEKVSKNDTLENDLFDLIDQMYTNKEEEE